MKHSYGNAGCPSHGVRRLFGRFQRRRAAPDALELQVKLEQSEELRIGLRRELNTVQAEISTLRAKLRPRKEILADLLQKTNEDLRAGLRYQVRPSTQSGQWETVTQWCCLDGCAMGLYTFASERDAMLFSILLDALGYEPNRNAACPECYAEYSKDFV